MLFNHLSLVCASIFTAVVLADHAFELKNNCKYNLPVYIDNYSGAKFTGEQSVTVKARGTHKFTIPTGWDGRICDNSDGQKCNDYSSSTSWTEYNLDSDSEYTPNTYDISNIKGFTVAQTIYVAGGNTEYGGCQTVTCTSANCACTDAYPFDNERGCGAYEDEAVRACSAGPISFTVTYC